MKKLANTKFVMPPGRAAAIASVEYQVRNMRSTKCWTLHAAVLRTSGKAMTRNSR